MSTYNMVAFSDESTVVSNYKPEKQSRTAFQSEDQLEKVFIKQLEKQGYDYLQIESEEDLINNLRTQLERLNDIQLTDNEWNYFFNKVIANKSLTIKDKTKLIQDKDEELHYLKRDDGSDVYIRLIDKQDIHKNSLQVINQYVQDEGNYINRYDVTILVNGLPLVHIELKKRGGKLKEAFNQIDRYRRDSFWAGSGLFDYIQIFVISNGTDTKYYSNTTRSNVIDEHTGNKKKKIGSSFEFTSYWSDTKNNLIPDLVDFTKTFFSRHTLLNILTKYCVFTREKELLVMRPYQIAATEKIINKIKMSANLKKAGTNESGGYIWHTTGSGKTLTSFKTAQIARDMEEIDKVIFVVDRKDLDSQTLQEYNKFEKGSANGIPSTSALKKLLEKPSARIIVTTIQKLNNFIKKNKNHPVYKQNIVLIFDEAHRSQFGDMHRNITKHFKNYYIFGFTGTPIFAENRGSGKNAFSTTEQIFGPRLHTYTIINAINDHNVLPFSVDTVNTFAEKEGAKDEKITSIDKKKNFHKDGRINLIVDYILDNFDRKTKRKGTYPDNNSKRKSGFNSLFAVDSQESAQKYYRAFKEKQKELDDPLRIATIFSYSANEEDVARNLNPNGIISDESFDTEKLDKNSRDFLEEAIADYNEMFETNFDTSSQSFPNYYMDLTKRLKDRELDLAIVVDMLLTGFDAPTLNTLWLDKNLRMHGLIQAFSRTNRIHNNIKTFGNIVTFRDLQKEMDEALTLFGNKDAQSVVILESYDSYYNGFDKDSIHHLGYKEVVEDLKTRFPDVHVPVQSREEKKEFAKLFGQLLRLINILSTFPKFDQEKLLSEADFQDYTSSYYRIRDEIITHHSPEDVSDDLVFEIELARTIEVDIDYILKLIAQYHKKGKKDQKIRDQINRNIDSSIKLRSKKELINNFIDSVNAAGNIENEWIDYVETEKNNELDRIIKEERLIEKETKEFMTESFRKGNLEETGPDADKIFIASRFDPTPRYIRKEQILEILRIFFDKFSGLVFN